MELKRGHIENLIRSYRQSELLEALFDQLPDIVFFVKDSLGKYLVVNTTLVTRCGAKNKQDLIGQGPSHLVGKELGKRYEKQDMQVITTGQPLLRYLELHNYQSQEIGWCLTTKIPIYDNVGQCCGLIGVSQDLKLPDLTDKMLQGISSALVHAEQNLHENPSIGEMARVAKMSTYQLDRRMKLVFGLTTGKWLLKTRITKASQFLIESNMSILDIAFSVGYNDQSAFTRQFRKATGLTPTEFKKRNIK